MRRRVEFSTRTFRIGLIAFLIVFAAIAAYAHDNGISGHSGNPLVSNGATCTSCHSQGTPAPTIAISGPVTVTSGSTNNTYTLTNSGSPNSGLDVSATGGTFPATQPAGLQVMNGEITHTAHLSTAPLRWTFNWTAPTVTVPTTVTMYGASISGGTGGSTGKGSLTITVNPGAAAVSVAITPTSASLLTGATKQFSATVTGSSNTAVNWSTNAPGGLYTAPSTAGTYTVTATSAADNTKSASATVTVTAPGVVSVAITPTSASLSTGATKQFSATVTGSSNTAVNWSTNAPGGLYTAPSTAGTYTVTATSAADNTKSASATVTVTAPGVVSVAIAPTSASLSTGGTKQFSATVTGNSNTAVTWSTNAPNGLYTAPNTAGTYTVTATSVADPTKSASATVTVTAPGVVSVAIAPTSASLSTGGTKQFSATVTGSSNTAVTWSTNAPNGLYTAPSTAGTYTVKATSVADTSKSASATVTITAAASGNGSINGTVKDIVTGAVITGAKIADNTGQLTYTGSTGAYTFSKAAGTYTLTISANGYLSTTQMATVAGGATSTNNWSLTKSYGTQTPPASNMKYVVFAWNDLGMHCDQNDYSYFAVLPPYNTLHAQVFQHGGEGASLIRSGIVVSYSFPKKTNSTLHTNFWTYAAKYGWNVPANVGISGTKLAGNMTLDSKSLSYQAVGIPITPYDDDGTWDPYGTAVITVKDSSGNLLQTSNVVAPVSTELMCSNCHGTASMDSTLNPQLSILHQHDLMSGTNLVADYNAGKPHACASCHSSNALGMMGAAGVESLSLAIHNQHKDKMNFTTYSANTVPGCYNCHPGPKTQCLRGIMARAGKSCVDCHGDMYAMTASMQNGRQPWLQEPKCVQCHSSAYGENSNTLYRNSTLQNAPDGDMNGRIYCEACHNSTHAESTSSNPADSVVSQALQGDNYWIWNCNVCHTGYGSHSMHRGGVSTSTSGTSGTTSGTHTDD